MKEKFLKFMYGRYGSQYGLDSLTKFILILSILFNILIITNFIPNKFSTINYILIILLYHRLFSKNIPKRYAENQKFEALTKDFVRPFRRFYKNISDREYKYFKCPNCNQELRAPKRKGKIMINCNKCKHKFQVRT